MSRISYRSIAGLAIVTAAAWGGSATAQGGPAAAGLAAKVTALQAEVATLTAQVTTLQNTVTTLQGMAGAVQVWKDTRIAVPVQRNDATFVSDWTHTWGGTMMVATPMPTWIGRRVVVPGVNDRPRRSTRSRPAATL